MKDKMTYGDWFGEFGKVDFVDYIAPHERQVLFGLPRQPVEGKTYRYAKLRAERGGKTVEVVLDARRAQKLADELSDMFRWHTLDELNTMVESQVDRVEELERENAGLRKAVAALAGGVKIHDSVVMFTAEPDTVGKILQIVQETFPQEALLSNRPLESWNFFSQFESKKP